MKRTPALSRQAVRQLDQRAIEEFGVPGVVLMENAGRGVADKLCELGISGTVVICCGRGNNGGDGFVIARHLDLRGFHVKVICWNALDSWHGDAGVNAAILATAGIDVLTLARPDQLAELGTIMATADWIADALLGTGATGDPRPPFDRAISHMNAANAKRMAVDIPSGLDCDSGEVGNPTFRADHTCTFVAAKPGLLVERAQPYVGQLHVLDIGAPRRLVTQMLDEQ